MLLCGIQTWRLHSARVEIAEQGRLLDAAEAARDQAIAANQALGQRITAQNQAIANLAAKGQEAEKRAQAASRKILAKPVPKVTGHGPDAMNAFMKELFSD